MQQGGDAEGRALGRDQVEYHSVGFFNLVRALVGDRFAEARLDPDRTLRVTVVDLDKQDLVRIAEIAARLGIGEWIRTERADPDALAAWERLRHDLLRLEGARPGVLLQYPTPEPGYRRPPVEIHLSADADTIAADLHHRYGEFVSLKVGALPYPLAQQPPRHLAPPRSHEDGAMDPGEMQVALDGALTVRSGETVKHPLLLTNLSEHSIRVHTNGYLAAVIVDDAGAEVGGYAGAQHMPLVVFEAHPGRTVRIPMLVGTASYAPELGYRIPPGTWHLTTTMRLSDDRRIVIPPLQLTVVDRSAE